MKGVHLSRCPRRSEVPGRDRNRGSAHKDPSGGPRASQTRNEFHTHLPQVGVELVVFIDPLWSLQDHVEITADDGVVG